MDERDRWARFGEWLGDLVLRRGEPKTAVAKRAKVSPSTLSTLINGGRIYKGSFQLPSPEDRTLQRLAVALGVEPAELFRQAGREVPRWISDDPYQAADSLAELADIADEEIESAREHLLVVGFEQQFRNLPPDERRRVTAAIQRLLDEQRRREAGE